MKRRKESITKERSEIGTPAGENPIKGRKRHGTECLTDECETYGSFRRGEIDAEEEMFDDDFFESVEGAEEFNTSGGLTGTKVKGDKTHNPHRK